MYAKLVLRSARRSVGDYLIYLVTLTLCVGLFYAFLSISSFILPPPSISIITIIIFSFCFFVLYHRLKASSMQHRHGQRAVKVEHHSRSHNKRRNPPRFFFFQQQIHKGHGQHVYRIPCAELPAAQRLMGA